MPKKKAKRKARKKTVPAAFPNLPDEEVAYRLVKLYFEEIARMGFKRKLDLDAIINAYFYALSRLKRKDIELSAIMHAVLKEEKNLANEPKEEMFPSKEALKEKKKLMGTGTIKGKIRGTG